MVEHPFELKAITESLLKSAKFNDFVDFFEYVLNMKGNWNGALSVALFVYRNVKRLHGKGEDIVLKLFEKLLSASMEIGKKELIGSSYYNLGNFYRSIKENRKAFAQYRLAKIYDQGYLERHYYWQEVSGILFDLRRYRFSARAYSKAFEMKRDSWVLPRLADALMFSGNYKDALERFDEYLKEAKDPEPFWVLKHMYLEYLVKELGIESQSRNTKAAIQCTPGAPEKANREDFFEPIKQDALWNSAWFNLGVFANERKEFRYALKFFLAASIVNPGDIAAWSNVFFLAFNLREYSILGAAVRVAYELNGDSLINQLYTAINNNDWPEEGKIKLKDAVSELIQVLPRPKEEFTFRVIGEERVHEFTS